ncbi:MAG: CPBP family intramembrane metalloprotease [Tessaracoccus sp.]|uniref:CPBP family intramembrane glutamic endopeptidase n=1 Tax=Tessaracoccus sp. TaxID=1971211 RepID=UPI001ED085CF|nr:type II CAAX endopeptidase family protein [Tessaracoccus sp.]MBK7821869.1 CPBP family intramembrane metalloprotease [Tessaracoccus sp.]
MTVVTPQTPSLPPAPETPQTAALPYHRLALAGPRPRWWRPLAAVILSVVAYTVFLVLLAVVAVFAAPAWTERITADPTDAFDLADPVAAAFSSVMLALMIPAIAIGVRLAERRRLGTLSSVAGRLRVGLLGRYGVFALVLFVAYTAMVLVIDAATGSAPTLEWDAASAGLLAVALLLVPFQAAAEEYAFRALPQQVLGAWLRSPWWGIVLPVPLFVFGHDYTLPGQLSIAVFALAAGVLTWRTGGLEAAIALHVVNNAAIFILGAIGIADLSATDISWLAAALDAAMIASFTFLVLRDQGRRQIA